MIKATLKGLSAALMLTAVTVPAQAASFGVANADHIILANTGVTGLELVVRVQTNGSGQLVPPSVAVRNTLMQAPGGKVVKISLRKGARPVYVVRVKKGGQVRRFRVDARNGRVIASQ